MKQWQRIVGVSTLAATVLAGGLWAQQAESTDKGATQRLQDPLGDNDIDFRLAMAKLRLKEIKGEDAGAETVEAQELSRHHHDLFVAAARSDPQAQAIMQQALWQFSHDKTAVQSAPQVCQVAAEQTFKLSLLQAQQNQRIIGLLEELVKKTK